MSSKVAKSLYGKKLNDFIAENPQMKGELDVYYSTRLQPDLSIVYPDKRRIKKSRYRLFGSQRKYLVEKW